MSLIVQKYGGSSVKNAAAIHNVAGRIAKAQEKGAQVVAVVSAMGDTTDDLLALARQITDRPDPREMDMLLSTGEIVSCALVTMALRSRGKDAISLSGAQAGMKTDTTHGKARIKTVDPQRILDELKLGKIVIVAGFQGITDSMDITTLGRGGSDTTAVAIAAGIGADRCEIYTDVEGIYTADPRLVPNARKMDELGFEEMLELASYGAKMNPRSIEVGMAYNIPILVASSFKDTPGTLIHQGADMQPKVGEVRNRVRGIATDSNVAKITLVGIPDRLDMAANIFEPLASADISVDVIVQAAPQGGTNDLTFTVKETDFDRAADLANDICKRLKGQRVESARDVAKVTIVGTGMQDSPGYAARMFRALANAGIDIELITTSEIRITCIVKESSLGEAARVLHSAFSLDKP